MKKISILLILVFLASCKTPRFILKQPENTKAGAVAFGLVLYDGEEKNLLEESNRLKQPIASRSSFFEFNQNTKKIDYKNPLLIDFSTDGDTIEIEKEEYLEKTNLTFKIQPISYFILTNLDDNKERILGTTSYNFTTVRITANGRRSNQSNYEDILIQLDSSKENLKLKFIEGNINFLGIFLVDIRTLKQGKFLDFGEKKVGYVLNANSKLQELASKETLEKIYSNSIVSDISAEKKFLEKFISENPENYWRLVAKKRLSEINK